jgi:hypothetical protein
MRLTRLTLLPLLMLLWSVLPSGARAEAARTGTIVLSAQNMGIRLVARIPRKAYAPNALITMRVSIANSSAQRIGLLGFPQFCVSQNPEILITDSSGKQYPPGITPLLYPPCAFPLGPVLAPGQTTTATEYAVARASHVQLSLLFMPAGGSRESSVATRTITLKTGSAPAATATMHTSASGVYAVIHRPSGARGPMLYEADDICPSGGAQVSHVAYLWTSTPHTRLAPSCSAPSRWVAVAGWPGYPVAEIDYTAPKSSSRTDGLRVGVAAPAVTTQVQ